MLTAEPPPPAAPADPAAALAAPFTAPSATVPGLAAPDRTAPAQRRRRSAGPPNPTVGRPRGHALPAADRATTTRPRRGGARRRSDSAAQRRAPHDSLRTMQLVMVGIAAAIMLGVCGLSAFIIVADERRGREISTAAVAPPKLTDRVDISSRTVDPAPLTVDEVFPRSSLVVADRTYRVEMTHSDKDCHIAASGAAATLLDSLGCSQVIRSTLRAPEDGYLLTTGVFNLADEPGATLAHDQIKAILDSGRGRLTGMTAGSGTEALGVAPAQFGWHTRGHFLVYCVLVRADAQPIVDGDPAARRILYDAVELHLREGVLGKRAGAIPTGA
ncbi:hypothetical protein Sya03_34970 [Spirilliplanes yamanashiensis]|uniref:Uncharacterized protein n=1 Tax=Spirilliplanes yamanashiensis TaxID=42233 RepID=A0A8J3Y9W5_9ACTN|nr:hypothetical protein Sya03_34970 [Spirilliplanes yamanashiensis]